MNFRSPTKNAKGLGSTHRGSGSWLATKVSSVLLAILFLWFAFSFATLIGKDYATVYEWISRPFTAVLVITLIVSAMAHAVLGLEVVYNDYIASVGRRLTAIYATRVIAAMIAILGVIGILRVVGI